MSSVKFYLSILTSLFSHWALAAPIMTLSEGELIRMSATSNPSVESFESQRLQAESKEAQVKSQYDARLSGTYNYASSKEDAIIQFIPVFDPQRQLQIGLNQKTSYGASVSVAAFSEQLNTADGVINNATQVGARVGLELDIWKNFLGRLDRSQLRSVKTQKKVADIQADLNQRAFVLDVRKVYWSLVATELSLELSKKLVSTGKKQWQDSRRRLREGLGDQGDVARNLAQLRSRESSVLSFKYQKENLLGQLRSLLPELKNTEVNVPLQSALSVEPLARQCIAKIAATPKMDLNNSSYDEIANLLGVQRDDELRLARATDSIDIKLQAQYQSSGVDESHSRAYDEFVDELRNGYQVGVTVSVPLGGDLKKSRRSQVSAVNYRFASQIQSLLLQLESEHYRSKRAIRLLADASLSQNDTIESLTKSMKSTEKKYRQARVPLSTLIFEQDTLFNNQLQLLETKRQTMLVLLDYFKVFSKYPCAINQPLGVQQ